MSVLAGGGLTLTMRRADALTVPVDLSHLTPEQRARYEAMHARMMAALSYERVTVPGTKALAEWQRLKSENRGWPVIIGSDPDLDRIAEQFSINDPVVNGAPSPFDAKQRSPAEILAAASRLKFPADLRRWSGAPDPEELRAPVGDWPANPAADPGLSIASDILSGRPHDRVHILMIPTRFSWEVPAYLRWGDWNACPPPEYHVAALRSWHERFGAELVAINGDTMNLSVARRPKARDEAMSLAREQYAYCSDIVDQGVETISALAAGLMISDWWYFWWD